jgi:CHAT domain-containing protein
VPATINGAVEHNRRGDHKAALRSLCSAFELDEVQRERLLAAQIANFAGTILFHSYGDLAAASAAFRAAIALADPLKHASEAATAHANLANALFREGLLDPSRAQLAQAVRIAAGIADDDQRKATQATIAIKEGLLAEWVDMLDDAADHYKRAKDLANSTSTTAPPQIRRASLQTKAEALHNLASLETTRGHHADAVRALSELQSWARREQVPSAEAWATFSLMIALQGVNQHLQVIALYPELRSLQGYTQDASMMASADMVLATSYYRLRRLDEAKQSLERAARFFGERRMVNELNQAQNSLGVLALEQGRPAEADAAFVNALKGRLAIRDRIGEGITLSQMANLAWSRSDTGAAVRLLTQAVAVLKKAPDPLKYANALGSLGIVRQSLGQRTQARSLLEEAVSLLWRYRAVRQSPALGANENDRILPIYHALIESYLATGENDRALGVAEQLRAASIRFDISRPADTSLQPRSVSDAAIALTTARNKVFKALGARQESPSLQSEQAAAVALQELDLAMTRFELSAGQRASASTNFPAILTALQQALGKGRALLMYHRTDDRWILFVVTNQARHAIPLTVRPEEVTQKIAEFREFAWDEGTIPSELHWLYNALIAPARALIEKRDLIIIPSGELNQLPFGALHDGRSHLAQERIVSSALGVGHARQLLEHGRGLTAGPAVLLSAAAPTGVDRLLHAEAEVAAAATALPAAHVVNDAAVSDFHATVRDAAIVHIAAHAVADSSHPLLSRVLLTSRNDSDGYLSVSDIRTQQLRRRPLVILSACETNIGAVSSDESVHNLASAFLEAGAGAIVSSLWRVDDADTAVFMGDFYRALASGVHPALALHMTMRESMKRHPHPYYWAAFTYMGAP